MSHPFGTDYDPPPPPRPPVDGPFPPAVRKIVGVLAVVVAGGALLVVCASCTVAWLLCGRDGCL